MGPGAAENSPWIGRTIAGYRIDRHIGAGLTGDVFHAVSPALEPREVAIKILNVSRQLTPKQYQEFYARFEQEAAILKRLNNPHILRVLAAGQDEGTPYMVLPYVDGGTLSRRLENGPLSLDEAALYLAQLADALDSAHANEVVHRDIKPANILLDRRDDLFLTDFSIARLLDETQTGLTTTGNVMGTAAYMAPEQVKNEKGVGPAADIYSLGIVLYQMVTGRPPFSANTMYALMEKQVNEAPPHPRQFRDDLPEPADAVILKALAKNPRDRYASAGAFAQAFATALQGVWPAGLSPNVSASLPTDYSPLTLPTTQLAPSRAPFPVGRLTGGRALGAIVAVTLVVVVLAALLLNHGANSAGPGGTGSRVTPSATVHSPTVTVGPGTPIPTLQPGQPTPTPEPIPTAIPGQPTSTLVPTAIPTATPIPLPTLMVSLDPNASTDGQAHNAGNPYLIPLDAQYSNVTIQAGAYASAIPHCNGGGSGTVRFTATGTVEIDGTLTVDGQGYCGGPAVMGAAGGKQGDSFTGAGTVSFAANGGGGGGGDGADSGGAGGGYGSSGQNGAFLSHSFGGGTYGDPTLNTLYLGSGGGSSGAQSGAIGGAGGNGGGAISIQANTIVVTGHISADGLDGVSQQSSDPTNYRGGGGGSGGSILLHANTISLGNNLVTATGGMGGFGIRSGGGSASGGNGGDGRIRVEYTQSVSGSTIPAANIAKV